MLKQSSARLSPSLRRGHANLLCVVPNLTDDPRRESSHQQGFVTREIGSPSRQVLEKAAHASARSPLRPGHHLRADLGSQNVKNPLAHFLDFGGRPQVANGDPRKSIKTRWGAKNGACLFERFCRRILTDEDPHHAAVAPHGPVAAVELTLVGKNSKADLSTSVYH